MQKNSVKISNLYSHEEIKHRRAEKERLVTRFLREETYTTAEVLRELMKIETRSGAYKALKSLEKDGLIRSHKVSVYKNIKRTFWGITTHGIMLSYDDNDVIQDRKDFTPSCIDLGQIDHRTAVQLARVRAEGSGWSHWQKESVLRMGMVGQKVPDATAIDQNGNRAAIEVERHIKAKSEYEKVASKYLQAMNNGKYERIDFICPTAKMAARLHKIFNEISEIVVNEKCVSVGPEFFQNFFFTPISNWPNKVGNG